MPLRSKSNEARFAEARLTMAGSSAVTQLVIFPWRLGAPADGGVFGIRSYESL
jgi:hypothetical protein